MDMVAIKHLAYELLGNKNSHPWKEKGNKYYRITSYNVCYTKLCIHYTKLCDIGSEIQERILADIL